ncbi:pre-rRNA-processing protein IPI1 [Pelomyxa schiedti]|nr:pre-rRNA-processing protein IPI1 [Pelomyxa schiedti]
MPALRRKGPKTHLPPEFEKKKRKVGQKTPIRAATNTTVKARALVLQEQSVCVKHSPTEPLSQRQLSLPVVFSKLKHTNDRARNDAVNELKDFLLNHPEVIQQQASTILEKCGELVSDLSSEVRHSVFSLLPVVFKSLPENDIQQYMPLLCAYMCSGLAHLHRSVRSDAITTVLLLMEFYPRLVVTGHISMFLTRLADLISTSKPSAPTMVGHSQARIFANFDEVPLFNPEDPQAISISDDLMGSDKFQFKLVVVEGIARIVETMLTQSKAMLPTSLPVSTVDYMECLQGLKLYTTSPIPKITGPCTTTLSGANEVLNKLFMTIEKPLIEIWIECGASSPHPSCLPVLKLLLELLNTLLLNTSFAVWRNPDTLHRYLGHIFRCFPIAHKIAHNEKDKSHVTSSNILICCILSHFFPLCANETTLPQWVETIFDNLISLISHQDDDGRGTTYLPPEAVKIFPVLIRGLALPDTFLVEKLRLYTAFTQCFIHCPVRSTLKSECVSLLTTQIYSNSHVISELGNPKLHEVFKTCFGYIPKLLWELKTSNVEMTANILRSLQYYGRTHPTPTFASFQDGLIPFFFTTIPHPKRKGEVKNIYGPFVSLPPQIQIQALNILYYFPALSHSMLRSIAGCSLSPQLIPDILSAIFDLVQTHYERCDESLLEHVGFLTSIYVSAIGARSNTVTGKRRHSSIVLPSASFWNAVEAVCDAIKMIPSRFSCIDYCKQTVANLLSRPDCDSDVTKSVLMFVYSFFPTSVSSLHPDISPPSSSYVVLPGDLLHNVVTSVSKCIFSLDSTPSRPVASETLDTADKITLLELPTLYVDLFLRLEHLLRDVMDHITETVKRDNKNAHSASRVLLGLLEGAGRSLISALQRPENKAATKALAGFLEGLPNSPIDPTTMTKIKSDIAVLLGQ